MKDLVTICFAEATLGDTVASARDAWLVGLAAGGLLLWIAYKLLASRSKANTAVRDRAIPQEDLPVPPLIDYELLVVLTAAATVALGRQVVVRRITFVNQNTVSGWTEAGRASLHGSHNVRRNN